MTTYTLNPDTGMVEADGMPVESNFGVTTMPEIEWEYMVMFPNGTRGGSYLPGDVFYINYRTLTEASSVAYDWSADDGDETVVVKSPKVKRIWYKV